MKTPIRALALASILSLPLLSAAHAADTVLPAVGPQPLDTEKGADLGSLRVYTGTEQVNDGDMYYYPHTSYTVYRPDGSVALFVRNHANQDDESVETVHLPAGTYRVKADDGGRVVVPVVIKGARTTVVNLEGKVRDSESDDVAYNSPKAVKTADGQVVGWRAQ